MYLVGAKNTNKPLPLEYHGEMHFEYPTNEEPNLERPLEIKSIK
jgi:hypothetical protein